MSEAGSKPPKVNGPPKGTPKVPGSGGSRKGCPNKLTASVKEAIEKAFDEIGGARWLVNLAHDNPVAFATLLSKIIPKNITLDHQGGFTVMLNSRDEAL